MSAGEGLFNPCKTLIFNSPPAAVKQKNKESGSENSSTPSPSFATNHSSPSKHYACSTLPGVSLEKRFIDNHPSSQEVLQSNNLFLSEEVPAFSFHPEEDLDLSTHLAC